MGEHVQQEIISRIKKSKYYSFSPDSIPDEGHIDQLTIVIRYMEDTMPKERFLTFMDNRGHNGSDMAKALFQFLEGHNIDLKDCRGQSYDNAANRSGKYKGMQALIKDKNPLEFVPCFRHSLNLVGKAAVNTCSAAVHYFDFVQQIYLFFTASTARYATPKEKLTRADKQLYVPKRLNETRWSCRADATKAIVHGYREMREALYNITTDKENKAVARNEACNLYEKMGKLEIAIYATFWNDILERFNATNHILLDPKVVLSTAVKALKSLKTFIETKREKYEEYEAAGIRLSGTEEYTEVRHCVRNVRLNPLDYGKAEDAQMRPKVKFPANSFLPVIDQIVQSLSDRIAAYDLCERSGFLNRLEDMDAASLVSFYKGDLELSLKDELVHFVELVKLDRKDNEKIPKELYFYKMLLDYGLQATFHRLSIVTVESSRRSHDGCFSTFIS
ncbi:zinc finger MYM-type protein 1-like [Macrobrachium rosenbergii]|uniref:zinc finger MYM-type protein 1-like n=1 Tax=Macrobrachium rosenbergii TaxID=79674 RepID=UPI0034D53EDB